MIKSANKAALESLRKQMGNPASRVGVSPVPDNNQAAGTHKGKSNPKTEDLLDAFDLAPEPDYSNYEMLGGSSNTASRHGAYPTPYPVYNPNKVIPNEVRVFELPQPIQKRVRKFISNWERAQQESRNLRALNYDWEKGEPAQRIAPDELTRRGIERVLNTYPYPSNIRSTVHPTVPSPSDAGKIPLNEDILPKAYLDKIRKDMEGVDDLGREERALRLLNYDWVKGEPAQRITPEELTRRGIDRILNTYPYPSRFSRLIRPTVLAPSDDGKIYLNRDTQPKAYLDRVMKYWEDGERASNRDLTLQLLNYDWLKGEPAQRITPEGLDGGELYEVLKTYPYPSRVHDFAAPHRNSSKPRFRGGY